MSSVDSVRCEFRSVWSWWGMKAGSTTQVPVEQAWVEIEQMVYSFLECLNTHWLWNPVSCSWVFAQRNESIHPHKSWECPGHQHGISTQWNAAQLWRETWLVHWVPTNCRSTMQRSATQKNASSGVTYMKAWKWQASVTEGRGGQMWGSQEAPVGWWKVLHHDTVVIAPDAFVGAYRILSFKLWTLS